MYDLPSRMQVLYNNDCVSDQAIIYWYQKGSKPQGRQHFLKATETLVTVSPFLFHHITHHTHLILLQFLQEQEDSEEDEEDE